MLHPLRRSLRARVSSALRSDEGLGIVEVLAALMIFAVIAVGMGYSLIAMTRFTSDSSHRQAATNLAAAEIDRVQAMSDAFDVYSNSTTTTVGNTVFTVDRSVDWVSSSGASSSCGAGGGNLQYKRINVSVTWPGMYASAPVRADSVLAPASRINDPSFGTILVSVKGVGGTGRSGITVTVTPDDGNSGNAITTAIDPTDVDGCAYVLKVKPGSYSIKVSKTGFVERIDEQNATPAVSRQVTAGATFNAAFEFDASGSFVLKWGANSASTAAVPSNLTTTVLGALKTPLMRTTTSPLSLYPEPAGYQVIAGDAAACAAVDPENWNATSTMLDAVRAPATGVAPGAAGTIPIGMGVFTLPAVGNTNTYFTAVQVSKTDNGNPGCSTPTTYTFSTNFKSSSPKLALPYGSYQLFSGGSVGAKTTQLSTGITVTDAVISLVSGTNTLAVGIVGASATSSSGGSGTILTLDPRPVK